MKLSSILLSVAALRLLFLHAGSSFHFNTWTFFKNNTVIYNKQQTVNEEAEKQTKTEFYHQNECCRCLGLVWRRSSSSLVLSPQTQLEIQNKKHLVWGKLFKMNLDLRPQCILVNHKAAVQSFLMKLRFQNSEPDSLTLSDAQRWRGFYPALLLSLV